MTRAVLFGDRLAALTPDPAEKLGTVLLGRARAALLADLLVELGAVALAHEAPAHPAGFGNGHRAAFLLWHRMLLFFLPATSGRRARIHSSGETRSPAKPCLAWSDPE